MTKDFALGDVLSITTGILVSERKPPIDGVYDVLNFMTGASLMTHALPRAAEAVRPAILQQHPALAEVVLAEMAPKDIGPVMRDLKQKYGATLTLTRVALAYEKLHPLAEPILKGKNVIVLRTDE